jgi:hypothetical protein
MVQFNALNSILASYAPGGWRYGNTNNSNLANAIIMLGESYGQLGNVRGPLDAAHPERQATGCRLFGSSQQGQQTPWEKLRENAFFIAAGFNLSCLSNVAHSGCQSAASKTIFRPWEHLTYMPDYLDPDTQQIPDPFKPDAVRCEPVVVNLPFTPNNPQNQ